MKSMHLLAALLTISLGAFAAPAHAFDAEFDAAPPGTITVGEIAVGERLAARTDEYGEREVAKLVEGLRGNLERELGRVGRLADAAAAGAILHVVIEDAKPNRPTPHQQAFGPTPRQPRGGAGPMDPRTIMLGGATVSATLVDTDGAPLGRFAYSWQTRPDVSQSRDAVTWTDAHRTFNRFARRVADAIAAEGA
jgi:hypothetical protein